MEPGKEHLVCRLKKSLYGLKQSPRCWNQKLNEKLMEVGFQRCVSDTAVYVKGEGKTQVYLGLYVDDMLIFSEDLSEVEKVKHFLKRTFTMVDFGEVSKVLGIRIRRCVKSGWLFMDQTEYCEEILQRFGMEDCKPAMTPLMVGGKLSRTQEGDPDEAKEEVAGVQYRSAIGSLMYPMVSTRPDLASAIGILSRFMERPTKAHWGAVKHVLRYVQGTKTHGLLFRTRGEALELEGYNLEFALEGDPLVVGGFSDADWAGCLDTRRSTTGYVFMLGGAAVSWNSTRQQTVALSSTEAEYMAATAATQEVMWIRDFLTELGVPQKTAAVVYTDNQSALKLMQNPLHRKQVKHVNLRFYFLREQVAKEVVSFAFVRSEEQVADSLTKAVSIHKTKWCRERMGVVDSAGILGGVRSS